MIGEKPQEKVASSKEKLPASRSENIEKVKVADELDWIGLEEISQREQENQRKMVEVQEQLGIKKEKEQKIEPVSQRVFDSVYEQIKHPAGSSPEKHAENFLSSLTEGAKEHIDEIETLGLTNKQIYEEIWQDMSKYIMQYQNDPRFEKKKEDVSKLYLRLTEHVNETVKQGKVEPRTAKVFLRALYKLKGIGNYNALIRNPDYANIPLEERKRINSDFAGLADEMFEKQPEGQKYDQSGGFYHFNDQLKGDTKNRLYISARPTGSPEKVISAWQSAIEESGLQDRIYFKIPTGFSNRFETILIYQTSNVRESDIEKVMDVFLEKCPEELLNLQDMPTGIPLRRGVSMASEPANINTFRRYIGLENISYNQLIASLTQLSFELAYKDAQDNREAKITPKSLKDNAGKYFQQLVILSGINPDTMVPNSQGGKRPEWAEKISKL